MKLPQEFTLGVATAAYQIEGNSFGAAGKNHWDVFAQEGGTANGEDGAVACNHIEHWEKDLDLISEAGFQSYRFSFSWPRLFPSSQRNPEGFDFYDRLIDGMLERKLSPSATLYHWDLPIRYSEKGGWENRDTAFYFQDFAAEVIETFGDRLDHVATINEPWCISWLSHFLGHHAPGKTSLSSGVASMHNILLAHGKAMTAMRSLGQKNLGIVLNMEFAQAASETEKDLRAAQIFDGIYNRWFVQAISKGNYPEDILEFFAPHMPKSWADDMPEISQEMDWFGLNYYTRSIHQDDGSNQFPFGKAIAGPLPKTSMGWEIYPEGISKFLHRLKDEYTGDLPIFVTENGQASHDVVQAGSVTDTQRIDYYRSHLSEVLKAREDGVPVNGYYAWSLLDNFEWAFGYQERFGLVHVDYKTQKRTPKGSWHWFKKTMDEGVIS